MIEGSLLTIVKYHLDSLTRMAHIIYKSDDVYWILVDSEEKLDDVSKMPHYIKNDFIKYNSKPLKFEQINKFIKDIERTLNFDTRSQSMSIEIEDLHRDNLVKLKELKREFILKNLLD